MKRKRRLRHAYGVLLFLVVFVISGTGVCVWADGKTGNNNRGTGVALAKADSENPKRIETTTNTKAANTSNTTTNIAEEIPDRSGFAAQPGVPVGRDEPTEEKIVYLTIDDGPSKNTQLVLDILDKYKVKATFFVTNACPDYMGMIKTAYEKGHTIGMHTYTHDYQTVYASADAYFADLDAIGQAVKAQIGYVPCFIRFPGGSSNSVSANYSSGIMSYLTREVQNRGYQYYDWNVSSGDGAVRTVDEIRAIATSGTLNNIVLLCHDSEGKATTVEALPDIIEHYQKLGYEFRPLDRESYTAHHGISN